MRLHRWSDICTRMYGSESYRYGKCVSGSQSCFGAWEMMFIQSNSSLINHFEIHQYLEVRHPSSSPVDEQQTVFRENLLCWTLTWKKIRPCAKDCWMNWKEVRLFKNFLALHDVVFPLFRGWIPRLPTSPANDAHRVCDWLLCQQAQRNYRRSVGRFQICGDVYGQRGIQINFIRFTYPLSHILRVLQKNHFLTPGSFSRWWQCLTSKARGKSYDQQLGGNVEICLRVEL